MPAMAHATSPPLPMPGLRRRAGRPRAAQPPALPADVRLMNAIADSVFALAGAALVAAGVLWLMRAPALAIRAIQLEGEVARNSLPTIRANAVPQLAGNFFSLDLQRAQAAFESVPWVRRAVVRRVWPDRLAVRLQEHRAAALWWGQDEGQGADRLVNSFGEIFEADLDDVEGEHLPVLAGPEGAAAQMLSMWRRLQPALQRPGFAVQRLHLSGRGSWRADLDGGATLELGRGAEDEVVARTERFARTLAQVPGQWTQQTLAYADLRHTDGYALRPHSGSTAPLAPASADAAKSH